MVSVALPVLLFASLTVVSQVVSPARGQSLLPTLPSITTIALPRGGSVETYFTPGGVGVNQLHLIFSGTPAQVGSTHPLVTAGPVGRPAQILRQLTVSTGHFTEIVVLTAGTWHFRVVTPFGRAPVTFTLDHVVP